MKLLEIMNEVVFTYNKLWDDVKNTEIKDQHTILLNVKMDIYL